MYFCILMISNVREITKKILTITMIVIAGLLIANKSIFIHTHILADGTIVCHSHPYNKADNSSSQKTHHHTNFELILFQQLELLFSLMIAIFGLLLTTKRVTKYIGDISLVPRLQALPHNGRAPPVPSFQ